MEGAPVFRGNANTEVHVHIRDIVGAIEDSLKRPVSELSRLRDESGGACFKGTAAEITAAITRSIQLSGVEAGNWREPNLKSLTNVNGLAAALITAAESIAPEDVDRRDLALVYLLFHTAAVLRGQLRNPDTFPRYYFHAMGDRLAIAAASAKTDDEFAAVFARMEQLEREVHQLFESGRHPVPGLFSWFPLNREQARLLSTLAPADNGHPPAIPPDVCERVQRLLHQRYRQDGRSTRPDEEIQAAIAQVEAEIASRDQRRQLLTEHLTSAIRAIGLPESIEVKIDFRGDAPSLLTSATRCEVVIVPNPQNGVDFGIKVDVLPPNPLEEMLSRVISGSGGIEVIEVG